MTDTPLSDAPVRALNRAERQFVNRVGRFLTQIVSPRTIQRAVAAGYDNDEHVEGWRLHRIAAGSERPLEHAFAFRDLSRSGRSGRADALLGHLDEIENHWFPLVQRVIRRYVPRPHVERFEAAFFDGLSQQPKGTAVISSVEKLFGRVDDLEASDEPGAAKVHATLVKRGVEDAKQRASQLIVELRDFDLPEPNVNAQAVEVTLRAQREALDGLRLWFNDWRATLGSSFSLRERITLGFSRLRRSSSGAEEETFEEEQEDEDDTEDATAEAAA